MKLLWLKAGGLHPKNSGGKIRTYNLIKYLASQHDITFVSYYRCGEGEEACDPWLRQLLSRVVTIPSNEPRHSSIAFYCSYATTLLSRTAFQLLRFRNSEVKQYLCKLLNDEQYDLGICDFVSPVLNVPVGTSCPWVLFAHNVEAQIWDRRRHAGTWIARAVAELEFRKMRACEQRQAQRFDYVWTVSEQDKRYFANHVPEDRIHVIRTAVDASFFQAPPNVGGDPHALLFVGALDWWPNEDAVVTFCEQILPRIRSAIPQSEFVIVGRRAGSRLHNLAQSVAGIRLMSPVADVRPHLHAASVFVVPLRVGGGTRLKIYEAMASGIPVVSTTIGAEGLDVQSGENIILADDPLDFARACVTLLHNPGLRQRLAANALREIRSRHTWEIVGAELSAVLENVVGHQRERKERVSP